ncbi:hypothetical protein ABBQ38_003026 [Trebouxia sp. C0009 RCD-2024]
MTSVADRALLVDGAGARDPSTAPLDSRISSGLVDMLSSMLEAHVKVATGDAADEEGFLLQVSALCGLMQSLQVKGYSSCILYCHRSGVLSTADSG